MFKSAAHSVIAYLPVSPDKTVAMHAMEPCVRLQHVATVNSPVDGVARRPQVLARAEGGPIFTCLSKSHADTAFARWLFGSNKLRAAYRGDNRRRVVAIARGLYSNQPLASFAALGAPDYAGKTDNTNKKIET